MLLASVFLILAVYAIGFTPAAATPHSLAKWSSRHNALQPLQKRVSGQFTYFAVGMGACGKQNVESDMVSHSAFVCGLPPSNSIGCCAQHSGKFIIIVPDLPLADCSACEQLWDGGSHCFGTVTIVINGITLQAQIVDRVSLLQ